MYHRQKRKKIYIKNGKGGENAVMMNMTEITNLFIYKLKY